MRAKAHNGKSEFAFTGALLRQAAGYTALCLELDVASEGRTPAEARRRLSEAVALYLETAFEQNLPYVRPVPPSDNPLLNHAANLVESFRVTVDFSVAAHA